MRWSLLALALLTCVRVGAGATKYEVDATLDPVAGRAEGRVSITWVNRTGEALERIPLIFDKADAGASLTEATASVGAITLQLIEGESGISYEAILEEPLLPGATGKFEMRFVSAREQPSGDLPYVSFEEAWFPLAPAIRDGRLRPMEEELADFEVELRFPTELKIALTGEILDERRDGEEIVYFTEANGVSGFGFAYSPDFEVLEAESAGVRIRSFYLPGDGKWGKLLMDYSVDIIAFYTETIGFYPQPVLDILPGVPQPWGGYPVTPNVVTIHRGLDQMADRAEEWARWIMAHEIGHQYWGFGTVLEDPRYMRWFGLSMGIFTDRLYSRARGLHRRLHDDFRWRYLGGELAGVDTTILQPIEEVERIDWDWNNIVAHGKAFAVLEMLEYNVGEEVFLEIFRQTLARFRGRVVTHEMFHELAEEISGADLDWFFHQWYSTAKVLDYRLGETRMWREEDHFVTEVSILRTGEAVMPVEVELETATGQLIRQRLSGWPSTSEVTFRSSSPPARVRLDPDRRLALISRARHQWIPVRQAALAMTSMGRSGEARALLEELGEAGSDETYYWYLLGVLRIYTGDFRAAEEALERIEPLVGRPGWERDFARGLLRLGNLRDLQGRRAEALEIYARCAELEPTRSQVAEFLEKPYERR